MSFISTIIENRYFNDIVDASNGFFLNVSDEIDLHKITKIAKMSPTLKFRVCERFGIDDRKSGEELNNYFLSFGKLNQYAIKNEVVKYLRTPKINRILNIYGNGKKINCDIEMQITIDTNNMLSNLFYQVLNPYQEISLLEEKESNIKTITYYIKSSFVVDGIFKEFKILDVVRDLPEARVPKNGISLSANLVPIIKSSDIPYFTKRFIEKYDIGSIVEIENVVSKMGLTIIDAFALKPVRKNKIKGLISISKGRVDVEGFTINVDEGTILIDKDIKEQSLGSYRFVILHECVHYELHKEFLTVRRQLMNICSENYNYDEEMPKAIVDDILKNNNKELCESKVEWQANSIAGRVLVQDDTLINELAKKYDEYNYFYSDNKESLLKLIASDLAKDFGSSREEMLIRMKQVSFFINDIDLAPYETNTLFPEEKNELYENDTTFKELIDKNKIIYIGNYCVVNDERYVRDGKMTFYAKNNPLESMLRFRKKSWGYDRYADDELYSLKTTKICSGANYHDPASSRTA